MNELPHELLMDVLFDGIYYVDLERKITQWNKAAERISGFSKAEVIGAYCSDNLLRHIDDEGHELCLNGCPLTATLLDGQMREGNVYLHHKRGHRVPVSIRTLPVVSAEGAIVGAVEVFADNSAYVQVLQDLERVRQEANVDELTNAGNRRYGEMSLNTRLYELSTNAVPFSIAFVDVDQMKHFNDTHGHQTGDEALMMVSRVISGILGTSDTVARWGGDEFVLILPNLSTQAALKKIMERIRVFIERSFIMAGSTKLALTVSIGATVALPNDTSESIIQRADALMYASKSSGGNKVEIG